MDSRSLHDMAGYVALQVLGKCNSISNYMILGDQQPNWKSIISTLSIISKRSENAVKLPRL